MLTIITLVYILFCTSKSSETAFVPVGNPAIETKTTLTAFLRVVPYETTAKLILRAELPILYNVSDKCDKDKDVVVCKAKLFAHEIARETITYLQDSNGIKRNKRQLLVGLAIGTGAAMLMNSIFTKLSHKVFGSDGDVEHYINQLRTAMNLNQKEHLLFSHALQDISKSINQSSTSLWRDPIWDRRTKELLFLSEVQAISTKIHLGEDRCLQHNIPLQFVPEKLFKESLKKIEKNVSSFGLKLSIPVARKNEYYKRQTWKVYSTNNVPIKYHSQTCTLQDLPETIAVSEERIETISIGSSFCDLQVNHLCLILHDVL